MNRFSRSPVPLILVLIALITKFVELGLEFGDPAAVGDKLGVIPALVLILFFSFLAYRKAGIEIGGLPDEQTRNMYE